MLTMPLLEGLDGVEKMSKSKNNYIGITEAPAEMYGKCMSISDTLMWRWFDLLSLRGNDELARLRREVEDGRNPRDVKMLLAGELVARFHSPAAAQAAEADFVARFRGGAAPESMPEVAVRLEGRSGLAVTAVLREAGLVPSASEAVRNIEQGGVRIDGDRVDDRARQLGAGTYTIQVGKRRWAKVTVS